MTTREFIEKDFGNADGKSRHCSSVVKDGRGNIFSYGAHYPLLFKIGNRVFRNTAGYSATTGKHIGWAWRADAIDVKLGHGRYYGTGDVYDVLSNFKTNAQKLAIIRRALKSEAAELQEKMDTKKRKNTYVYGFLAEQLARVENNLSRAGGVK